MKKKLALIILTIITLVLSTACRQEVASETITVGISFPGDYTQYNYGELKEAADIIVMVEVIDDLTEKNSKITYDEYGTENQAIVDFYSLRKVKIVESFSGKSVKTGDILQVIEPSSVDGNQYLYVDDYHIMQKGNFYILFLSNDTASGNYSIMSANNGTVNLFNIGNTPYYEIEAKAICEFLTDLPKTVKEKIIYSTIVLPGESEEQLLSKEEYIHITIKDGSGKHAGDLSLKYKFDETTNVTYIKFE